VITIDALRSLSIPTPTGATVPLSAIADVRLRESRTVINHEDGMRVVRVQSDIVPGANARDVQAAFDEALRATTGDLTLALPPTVRMAGGGETEESDQAFGELFLALVVGIVLMVAILVYEFNSFRHMRYVLSILPYSLIGIMFGLAITQNALSFPSIMGFIALSGIVVNNSILLIDMMNNERRRDPHKPIVDVVIDASVSRLRPIVLTTATTVTGMLPLIFSGDLWAPLAYAVMFGLLFSVVITLILIPIIYRRKPGTLG
jgi:multidrug efflux pump subunit AcrB